LRIEEFPTRPRHCEDPELAEGDEAISSIPCHFERSEKSSRLFNKISRRFTPRNDNKKGRPSDHPLNPSFRA